MIDPIIRAISPSWALKRAQARRVLAYYEAARPDKTRKQRREPNSASVAVRTAGTSIREQARHLEQNLDLARAVLRVLVNNTIGAAGITVEPAPRTKAGDIHEDFARAMLDVFDSWGERCEVTRQYTWPQAQRMLQRTAVRDGEVFAKIISGDGAPIRHAGPVPLSLELLEPDFFPIDHQSDYEGRKVREAVELNGWGAPVAYWAYREHPRDLDGWLTGDASQLVRIPADAVLHHAFRDRLHQRRGMSTFASILGRLDDLKDYETSESIAAKVAASLGAAIKKGTPDLYPVDTGDDGPEPRDMRFRPGMIFDDLEPGESIEMIGSNGRPNTGMLGFRNTLLKAATSGTGASYSTVSREYDGSYSARRQELVDAWVDYAVMSQDFAAAIIRPVYRRVMATAIGAGVLTAPADVDPASVMQAMYQMPVMPWIDPSKEQKAWEGLEAAGHASGPEIIRKRGRSPADVLREEVAWRRMLDESGITTTITQPAATASAPTDEQMEPDADV